jgi:hypothetical protein
VGIPARFNVTTIGAGPLADCRIEVPSAFGVQGIGIVVVRARGTRQRESWGFDPVPL